MRTRELLTDAQRYDEWVLLGIRIAEGLPAGGLDGVGRAAVAGLIDDDLIHAVAGDGGETRLVLTLRGRLLADLVTRRLLGW